MQQYSSTLLNFSIHLYHIISHQRGNQSSILLEVMIRGLKKKGGM